MSTNKTQNYQALVKHLPKTNKRQNKKATFYFADFFFNLLTVSREFFKLLFWIVSGNLHTSLTLIWFSQRWAELVRNICEQRSWGNLPFNSGCQLSSWNNRISGSRSCERPSRCDSSSWSTHFVFLFLCSLEHCIINFPNGSKTTR